MDNDMMRILLQAKLDPKSIDNITAQIKSISDASTNLIKLKVEFDNKQFQHFAHQLSNVGKELDSVQHKYKKVFEKPKQINGNLMGIDPSEIETIAKQIKSSVDKISKLDITTSAGGKVKTAMVEYEDGMGRVVKQTLNWTQHLDKANNIMKNVFKTTDFKITDNIGKREKEQVKAEESIQNAIALTIKRREEENRLLEERQSYYINKNIESNSPLVADVGKAYTEATKLNRIYDEQSAKLKTLKGTFAELKGEQTSGMDVARKLSEIYGGLEIRGYSLDKVTGAYNVQLKLSAKENLNLLGTLQQVNGALSVQNEKVTQAKNVQLGFWEQMKIAMQRVPIWMGATTVYFQGAKFAKDTIEEIKLLNKEMISLEKVSTATKSELDSFYNDTATKMARELGVLTSEVINTTAEISKLGYSLKDSEYLTNLGLIGKTVGNLSTTGEAVDYLTSILKGFRLETEKGAEVLDFLNYTANNQSLEFKDLGNGFQRMSASMAEANNTIAESAGLLTAGFDITRDAERTSNALKTSSMRIRGVSEDGTDLGNLVPKLEEKFNSFGLSLKENNNTFKSTFDILKSVSTIWDDISDMERADLLEDLGGKINAQAIAAIITNFQKAEEVAGSFAESQGSAILEHQKYLKGVESAQNTLNVAMTDLHNTLLKSDTIIKALNLATFLVDNTSALGKFSIGLAIATIALGAFAIGNRRVIKEMEGLQIVTSIGSFKKFASDIGNSIKMLLGMKTSATSATVSVTALNVATGALLLGIPLLMQGIGWVINHEKKLAEETTKVVEAFNKQKDVSKVLEGLIASYKELGTQSSLTAEEQQKLLTIKQNIIDLLPKSKTFLDSENLSLEEQISLVEDLNERELTRLKIDAQKIINGGKGKYEEEKKQLEDFIKHQEKNQLRLEELSKKDLSGTLQNGEKFELKELVANMDRTEKGIVRLTDRTTAYESAVDIMSGSLDINTNAQKDNADANHEGNNGYKTAQELMEKNNKLFDDTTTKLQTYNSLLSEINSSEGLSVQSKQDIIQKHAELLPYISDEQELRKQLISIIAQEEKVQQQAYINKLLYSEEFFNAMVLGNTTLVNQLNEAYKIELKNFKSLAEAKLKVEEILMSTLSKRWAKYYDAQSQSYNFTEEQWNAMSGNQRKEWMDARSLVVESRNRFDSIAMDLGGMNFKDINMSSVKDTKDKKEKDSRQFLESIDAEIRAIKLKNDALLVTEESLKEQLALAKDIEGMEGLNEQYRITGELIAHNTIMLESFKKEQELINARANSLRGANSKYDTTTWFDANSEQTTMYIELYNAATKDQQEEMSELFTKIQKLKQAWMESAKEVDGIVTSTKELTIAQDDLIAQQRELANTKYIEKYNKALAKQQEQLSAVADIEGRIVEIIRKRGEAELKALDESYNKDMEQLDKRHNKRKENYANELDLFRKNIEAQLDLLDTQYDEEDYLENLKKERDKATELQKNIDVLSLDNSLTAKNQVIELRKQLATQNESIAKLQQDRERKLLKDSLQDQLDGFEESIKDKEEIADDFYEEEKKKLDEDYEINKRYLERKYSDEKVYSEARQAILDGEVEVAKGRFVELEDAFEDFEDKFGQGMGILGDIIKDEFTSKLEDARDLLRETANLSKKLLTEIDSDAQFDDDVTGFDDPRDNGDSTSGSTSSSSGKISDMSSSDYLKYLAYKQLYEQAQKAGDNTAMNMANDGAKTLRRKYGITSDLYSYNDLKGLSYNEVKSRGYANGGKITETGTIIAPFHGTKTNPEWILNDSQFKDILKNAINSSMNFVLPKIPSIAGVGGGAVYHIDKIFDISGTVTKDTMPLIRKEANDIAETLKNLNKGGIFRPVKM